MIRDIATIFAGLLGLAFGSFLNVCVTRWPAGESIVEPRSHCRGCARSLTWWENVPLLSWILLRGRCRTCGARIGLRYLLVEAAVGFTWALLAWRSMPASSPQPIPNELLIAQLATALAFAVFTYLLIGLAALDAEYLWLPDVVTYPGIVLGVCVSLGLAELQHPLTGEPPLRALLDSVIATCCGLLLILIIWGVYWIVRRKEGIGLGDAKLMAMLGAWLGLGGALLSFAIGVVLGAIAALLVLARSKRGEAWAGKLPLGTFLCVGGLVASLWGPQLIGQYLRWAGF